MLDLTWDDRLRENAVEDSIRSVEKFDHTDQEIDKAFIRLQLARVDGCDVSVEEVPAYKEMHSLG